jgi:pyridoxamine 5'-phosphate oxidase
MSASTPSSDDEAIAALRREYRYGTLGEADVSADPLTQFQRWFAEAQQAMVLDYNAMALATAWEGEPSVRTVLLKGADEAGMRWFTDRRSEKGQALTANPRAELLFLWRELDRQVRIRGRVVELSSDQSDGYFYSRPLGSQLAAATSHQSHPIADRTALEARYQELAATHIETAPRPSEWGGYCLQPSQYEFWQGREGRLHDRLQYRQHDGLWTIARLQP